MKSTLTGWSWNSLQSSHDLYMQRRSCQSESETHAEDAFDDMQFGAAEPSESTRDSFDIHRIHIAPPPFFAALRRLNDGVMGGCKVSTRMLVLRRIAATHMAAFKAHAQMHPLVAGLEATLAAFRSRLDGFDVIFYMRASLCLQRWPLILKNCRLNSSFSTALRGDSANT